MRFSSLIQHSIIALLLLSLYSCAPHYEKIEDQWAWVSYDEAVGKRVVPLDSVSDAFEILPQAEYARDDQFVFFKGRVIEGADPASFETLKQGYTRDDERVYLHSIPLIKASPRHFKVLKFPYAADDSRVYCGTLPLIGASPGAAKVLKAGSGYGISLTTYFQEQHPDYTFIDPSQYPQVLYGSGRIRIGKLVFEGFEPVR